MQNKQLKRPYSPPEITAVEFRVEVGQQVSTQTQIDSAELLMRSLEYQYGRDQLFQQMQSGNGWASSGFDGYSGYFGNQSFGSAGGGWSSGGWE